MHGRANPFFLISIILALVALCSSALAGAVYLLQREDSTAPLVAVAIASPVASASAEIASEPPVTPTPAPSATQTATPAPTPSPSPSPAASAQASAAPAPSPAATAAAVKAAVKTITISALIDGMGDRPLDAYGSVGIVKRGRTAYYAWAQDLYLYDGKSTKRILQNAACTWMYADASQNLWFGIKGGAGIVTGEVKGWDSVYRYDRVKGAFTLVKSESAKCRLLDGYGLAMYGSWFFCEENGMLTATNTADGAVATIDSMLPGSDIRVAEGLKAVYYQNAKRQYMLLSYLGEKSQSKIALDMRRFPGGRFDVSDYVLNQNNVLYRFQRTGYERLRTLDDAPAGAAGGTCLATGSGVGFARGEYALMDCFDFKTGAWSVVGDPRLEAAFCGQGAGGRFWFVGWKPASLTMIYKGKCTKYDLSKAMGSCTWAGTAGNAVFLSDNDFFSSFTHVFLADKKQLYLVQFPPLPGEGLGE